MLAMDSRHAWKAMSETSPNVVVVDIQTGSAGGYGLARDMSMNDRLRDVPILLLLERVQDGWLARQGGATRWLTKPVEAAALALEALAIAR